MQPAFRVPEYIRTLIPYVPGKPIEETKRELGLKRVVKLASNENPLGPSPRGLRAAQAALKELHRYPDSGAYRLKQRLKKLHHVDPNQILVGNGSNEIIDLLIRSYCLAGDAMVTSQAAFIAYRLCAQIHGVRTLEAPLAEGLRFDLPACAELADNDEQTRIIFVANPNNPTGTYVTEQELRAFLDRVAKIRDGSVVVALDYAYWEYVTAKDLPDALSLVRKYPNVVMLRTFSKVYGLAGLRIGYAVASAEITGTLEKVRQPFNFSAVALAAAAAALDDVAFVRRARAENAKGLRFWEKELGKLGVPFWPSQGNFLLVDVETATGRSGPEVFQACLKQGVIFRPVANYGLKGALRISMGTAAENAFAIKAFSKALK